MRAFTVILATVLIPFLAFAQAPSPDEVVSQNVPWSIAKIPEKLDFNGVWLRSDGGYRIEIKNAEVVDAMVVKYFNPGAINVESGTFDVAFEELVLTVILRDEGYPGSTYQLTYLPQRGVLDGTYTRPNEEPSRVLFLKKK